MVKKIIGAIIGLAVVIGGGAFITKTLGEASQKAPTQYRVAKVELGTVKKTVTATGTLQAWKKIDIKSRAGGRVVNLAVEEGQRVTKGDMIAQIDPSDTQLNVNNAMADIASNKARVAETESALRLQIQQSKASIATAESNLKSSRAAAVASKARWDAANEQANAQSSLTESAVENAKETLAAEQERYTQMKTALQLQQTASAEGALNQAKANLKNAEQQLNRQKTLLAKGFVAQSQVDQAEAAYEVALANFNTANAKMKTMQVELDTDLKAQQARVRQAQASLKSAEANRVQIALRKQDAAAAKAQFQQAESEVVQSKARLEEAKASYLSNSMRQSQILQARASGERAKASFQNANIQLKDTTVVAPSDGIVLQKYIEQGTFITSGMSFNSTGTNIVQMGDISRMYVDVQVDETDIANVEEDQMVDITFDAYPSNILEGKVIKIQPQAVVDQNVTTVHVWVEVDNSQTAFRLLKPGMNATCEFIVNKKSDVVQVPNEALKNDSEGAKYVEVPEGGAVAKPEAGQEPDPAVFVGVTPKKVTVTIGLEGNSSTEIKTGLKESDSIITQTIEPTPTTPGSTPQPRAFGGGGPGPGRR